MEAYLYLILIGLHIFALWPITLVYCRTKKKRKTRVVGKSCESLLIDPNKQRLSQRSTIKSSLAGKKLTPSKMLRAKPGEKKDESNPKKPPTEISEDKKDDVKIIGTTGETEKSSAKNAKTPGNSKPSPKKEQSSKKPEGKSNRSMKEKATDKTQVTTDNDTQLSNEPLLFVTEKTQSETEYEGMHQTD